SPRGGWSWILREGGYSGSTPGRSPRWGPSMPARSSSRGTFRPVQSRSVPSRSPRGVLGGGVLRCGALGGLGAGFLRYPGQVALGTPDDGGGDDFGLVVAMPFGQQRGQRIVTVRRQLEHDQPFLGPLNAI